MYYVNIDNDGWLLSISDTPMPDCPEIDSLEGLDLSGARINAYHWDGEKLMLDEVQLSELMEQEHAREKRVRIEELKAQLAATDYAVIKIAERAATEEEYADIIAQRKEWRAEINKLEVTV